MMETHIQMRKRCMMEAIQLWLDQHGDGWKVAEIVKPDLAEFEILVKKEDDEPRQ